MASQYLCLHFSRMHTPAPGDGKLIARAQGVRQRAQRPDSQLTVLLLQVRVAMGNANSKLKDIAHFTAPSNDEDGVAAAIQKLLNGEIGADESSGGF
jgi:haloacid dehalogenase-like hydrolase